MTATCSRVGRPPSGSVVKLTSGVGEKLGVGASGVVLGGSSPRATRSGRGVRRHRRDDVIAALLEDRQW